jgi:putative hydrolase of the HAD superfamily
MTESARPDDALADHRWMSFDVVGTLIDVEAGIAACVHGIAPGAGLELDDAQVLECFVRAKDEQQQKTPEMPFTQMLEPVYLRMAAELGLPTGEQEPTALRGSIRDWPAFPDSAEALLELRERYRLVACTNADNWALEQMGRTLGDPFHDIATAKRLGVRSCWTERRQGKDGYGATPSPAELTEPDHHFSSLAELAAATRR